LLSKPDAGWTKINLLSFSDRAGYKYDVSMVCLDAARQYLKGKREDIVICFDAESYGEWLLTADKNKTTITYFEDKDCRKVLDIGALEIANQIAHDIRQYFDLWVDDWDCARCSPNRRQIMTDKLASLERLLKEMEK